MHLRMRLAGGRWVMVLAAVLLPVLGAPRVAAAGQVGWAGSSTGDVVVGHATRLAPPLKTAGWHRPAINEPDAPGTSQGLNIVWTNRGPGDGFDDVFGAGTPADMARADIDGAIDAWERTIADLNRPSTPGDSTINVTVTMNAGDDENDTSCGGSASGDFDGDGWPEGGDININGNANVWFVDPSAEEHSEFAGNITNAFAGDTQAFSPAQGLCDMYTVVVAEVNHIMGITSNTDSRFQTGGYNTQLTNTGTTCAGPGDLWQFTGPDIVALMTSNNGGQNGSDKGVPVHTAEPCSTFGTLSGSQDAGNALFEGSRRYLPSNLDLLILEDVYNYELVMPERSGTFYTNLNGSTGDLKVSGGDDSDGSADVVTASRNADQVEVSVDVGNDIPGTGPTDAFDTVLDAGLVQSITIGAGDADDSVTIGSGLGLPVTVNGDDGNDTLIGDDVVINGGNGNDYLTGGPAADILTGGPGNDTIYGFEGADTISGDAGNDQLFAGTGDNDVADGSGDDLVDMSENAAAMTFATEGGNDTVVGSPFSDYLIGSTGADRLEGRNGDDTLLGQGGDDALFGNDGSDTFPWDTADGSDVVEGGAGESDALSVTGSVGGDTITALAQPGSRLDVLAAGETIDSASVEDFSVDGSSGSDTITIHDLTDTDVATVDVELGSGATDAVTVDGRTGPDTLEVGSGSSIPVSGLPYSVAISGAAAGDTLNINAAGGTDAVTVDGTTFADNLVAGLTGAKSATVAGGPIDVVATSTESLAVDGDGGNDALVIQTPAGADDITLTPGAAPDAGSVSTTGLIPFSFLDLGLPGSVRFTDAGGGAADSLRYNGTAQGDSFSVAGGTGVINLGSQSPVTPTGIASLALHGLAGDDTFAAAASLPFATTSVNGGDSTNGDALSLMGASGPVIVDLSGSTVTGYGGTVSMAGVEKLSTAQDGSGGASLTVLGTAGRDAIDYRPTSAQGGSLSSQQQPQIAFTGVGGAFTIDPGADADEVDVLGTIGADAVTVLAGPVTTVQVGSMLTANVPVSTSEIIGVLGDAGADDFDITVYDNVSPVLAVQGDKPSAKKFSDSMTVRNGSGSHVKYSNIQSHTKGDGSVLAQYNNTGQTTRIDYGGVEQIRFFH